MKRIVVGLSGGVDSSVAAYLLKKQGYEVIGMFMKNWHDDTVTISDECPWLEDSYDAMMVAESLGIPFQSIDLSKEYKERIVDYMFKEYQQGRTPNPDILCNREIKFDLFLKTALKLNADFVATGHYCRKDQKLINSEPVYRLLAGVDQNKDQSYFLCQLSQYQLSKSLFPIGHLKKEEVRKIASDQGFVTANKKDSQGLCFIGKVKLPDFLQQQLKPKKGKVIEIDRGSSIYQPDHDAPTIYKSSLQTLIHPIHYTENQGQLIGEHQGAHYYTVGQRKGLSIGGKKEPLFVLETDINKNIIYMGQGVDHPGLFRSGLFVKNNDIHWVRPDLLLEAGEKSRFLARIRYRQPLEEATLYREEEGLFVVFDQPQKAIAAGQFVAWYLEDELIGSGVIDA